MPLVHRPSPNGTPADARRHGRETGCRAKGLGVDCPYWFDVLHLRQQWFAGFSEGRAILRQVLLSSEF